MRPEKPKQSVKKSKLIPFHQSPTIATRRRKPDNSNQNIQDLQSNQIYFRASCAFPSIYYVSDRRATHIPRTTCIGTLFIILLE